MFLCRVVSHLMYAVRALLVAAMAIGGAGDRHACLTKMIVTPAIHRELVAGADFPLNERSARACSRRLRYESPGNSNRPLPNYYNLSTPGEWE